MTEEPRAWMRRYAFDRDEGTKGNRPKHWTIAPVTLDKLFPDDVPLFARDSDGNPKGGDGTAPSQSDDSAARRDRPHTPPLEPPHNTRKG